MDLRARAIGTFADSAFVDNTGIGAGAATEATRLELTRCVVRGTVPDDDANPAGFGVLVQEGAEAALTDCAITDNTATGVFAHGDSTEVTAVTSAVTETRELGADPGYGHGVAAADDAQVTLSSTFVGWNVEAGLAATGNTISLEGHDLLRVAGGKIVEHWTVMDSGELMRQLGVG